MATPLKRGGGVSTDGVKVLVDFLIEGGIDGLLPLGTSGEFALLTEEEKRVLLNHVVDQTNGRVPVVAGISDPSTENVLRFSKDAKDAGVDGVIATPPYYYSTTSEALYKHYKRLSEGLDLPLMVYNIPEWTHSFVPPEIVQKLADERLVVGMKYTEYNFLNLLKFLTTARKKIAIFTGSDALAYSNLEFGGSGGVIGVANVAPKIAAQIFDEFKRGNLQGAREAQLKLLPVIEAIGVGKFPAGLKEAMNMIGMKVGEGKEPIAPLTDAEKFIVKEKLGEAGLL